MKVQRKCDNCSIEFTTTKVQIDMGRGRFCSYKCYHASQRNAKMFECFRCGKSTSRRPSEINTRVYCSKTCYHTAKSEQDPRELFLRKIEKRGECWEWTAARYKDGYGMFSPAGRTSTRAHRYSWEIHSGPIPPSTLVCHSCDNRLCVNPAHLFLGSVKDNVQDKVQKGRQLKGMSHHKAKLTEATVRDMRTRYIPRVVSIASLAAEYGVSQHTAQAAISRKTWKHVS